MITLKEITIKEFKKQIYKEYKKLFPAIERKPYYLIRKTFNKGFTKILKIINDNITVGFFILNTIDNYIQIDYFAIFEKYQSKGYGSAAIKELQNTYPNNQGIFIEIEKLGLGSNDAENTLREKRFEFYNRLGFKSLDFDILLYGVIYTPCHLNFDKSFDKEYSINTLFNFYYLAHSKRIINKNCKVIE